MIVTTTSHGVSRGRWTTLAFGITALFASVAANAQDDVNPVNVVMERFHNPTYQAGAVFNVQVRISSSGDAYIQALGLRETLPNGWTFTGLQGVTGDLPAVSPTPGQSGLLEFAWISIPQMPYTFAYTVQVPEDAAGGGQVLHGQLEYRLDGPAQYATPVITTVNGAADTQAPVITLSGGSSISIQQGGNWSEPGYNATDNVDGNLTSQVQVSGDVNPNVVSSYVLTYTVSDKAGNQGRAQRTVRVTSNTTANPNPNPVRPPTGGVGTGGGTGVTPDGGFDGFGGGVPTGGAMGNTQNDTKQAAATNAQPAAGQQQNTRTAAPTGSLNMRPTVRPVQRDGEATIAPEPGQAIAPPPAVLGPRAVTDGSASPDSATTTGSIDATTAEPGEKKLSDEWPELAQTLPAQVDKSGESSALSGAAGASGQSPGPQGLTGNLFAVAAVVAACLIGIGASMAAARSVYGGRRRRTVPPRQS